ncbi:hypothetical protein JCM6882_000635 [Rhodosporidiobolus microsporus]
MDPGALTEQQLVDYLVHATEEQDTVFVLYWLHEMKKRGMLEIKDGKAADGVTRKHSWKRYSALVAVAREEETPLRRLILQLLLHFVPDSGDGEALKAATTKERRWATHMVATWGFGGRQQAAVFKEKVLDVEPGDALDWIDRTLQLPPPPNPDALTGADPLPQPEAPTLSPTTRTAAPVKPLGTAASGNAPTRPSPPSPTSIPAVLFDLFRPPQTLSTLAPSPDQLGPRLHPSFAPSAWGHPQQLVRLSSLSPATKLGDLRASLPSMGGLASINVLDESTVILGFATSLMAKTALPSLQGRQDGTVAQLEAAYRLSLGYSPSTQPVPPFFSSSAASCVPVPAHDVPPAPFCTASAPYSIVTIRPNPPQPPQPFALSRSPPSPAAAPAAVLPSSPLRISINNLPPGSAVDDVRSLFDSAGVEIHDVVDRQLAATNYRSYSGTVASAADYERALSTLHRARRISHLVYLGRLPPQIPSFAHPFVVVHGLPLVQPGSALVDAARRAGCGGYAFQTRPAPDGRSVIGWMRVETAALAALAVRYITGEVIGGARVRAEWRAAEGTPAGASAPQFAHGDGSSQAVATSAPSLPSSFPPPTSLLPAQPASTAPAPFSAAVPAESSSSKHPFSARPALALNTTTLTRSPTTLATHSLLYKSAARSPAARPNSTMPLRPPSDYPSPKPTPGQTARPTTGGAGSEALEVRGESAPESGRAAKRAKVEEGDGAMKQSEGVGLGISLGGETGDASPFALEGWGV